MPIAYFFTYRVMERRNKPYKTKEWKEVREKVLKMDKGLCQRCLGKYKPVPGRPIRRTKAVLVHHNFELLEYPEWKYSIFVIVNGKKERNLVSLCNDCHEEIHERTHRSRSFEKKEEFTTEERWD